MSAKQPRKHRTRWTEEDDRRLRICVVRSLSADMTAQLLNRTVGAVIHRAAQLGMHFPTTVGLRNAGLGARVQTENSSEDPYPRSQSDA